MANVPRSGSRRLRDSWPDSRRTFNTSNVWPRRRWNGWVTVAEPKERLASSAVRWVCANLRRQGGATRCDHGAGRHLRTGLLPCSYGFRPGRSAHQALRTLQNVLWAKRLYWVLDIDIRKYFVSIPHFHLRAFLDQRVTDGVIRRMIDKWLKAGAVEGGLLSRTTEGSPQGGVISPCLSNVFLHHVLDEWFETVVKPRLRGECVVVRFADDALMAFDNIDDAKRVLSVLGKRLGRYGLTLHPDKTRLVDFRPQRGQGARHPETDGTSFDFLGLTHVWGRSRNGKNMVRQVTAKDRYARAVAAVTAWCREHRHWSFRDQHRRLSSMMRGHFAYYGVGGNSRRLRWFANQVVRVWRKWLSRRHRGGVVPWARFNALLARHPLPSVRILHGYAAVSEPLS